MVSDWRTRLVPAAGLGNLAWGGFLLLTGELLWQDLTGRTPSASERVVVRVLGVRHLAQGLAQVAAPDALPWLWRFMDLSHAGSMVPVVALDRRRRRPATVSAAVSLASALVSAPPVRDASVREASGRLRQQPATAPRRARR